MLANRAILMIALGSLIALNGLATFAAPGQTQETLFSALPLEAPAPADNPTTRLRVELGRLLFWDPILSGTGDVACATCHHPDFGYADGRDLPIGVGGTGLAHARRFSSAGGRRLVKRNSQSLLNVAFNGWTDARPFPPGAAPMFWDVRARGLEAQALVPIENIDEMRGDGVTASRGVATAVSRLAANAEYAGLFANAFGGSSPVSDENLGRALAAFQRTLITPQSPFDRFQRGDRTAMTDAQQRGMEQFLRAGCAECHAGPMFSDYKVHTLGTPGNPKLTDPDSGVAGTYGFRTPTLRNLALTAPYMHNGVFQTLDEVVTFYLDLQRRRPGRPRHAAVKDDMLAPLQIGVTSWRFSVP